MEFGQKDIWQWTKMLQDPEFHYFCRMGLIPGVTGMDFIPAKAYFMSPEACRMRMIYLRYRECQEALKDE